MYLKVQINAFPDFHWGILCTYCEVRPLGVTPDYVILPPKLMEALGDLIQKTEKAWGQ